MLGIQQTHPAAPHHPTTRSAATAAAAVTGQLRSTPISKRRPSGLQKQQFLDTVSATQDNPEAHAEAAGPATEDSSVWPAPSRDEQAQAEQRDGGDETIGAVEEQNGTEVTNENPQQDGDEQVEQERRDENGQGEDSKPDGVNDYTRHPSSPLSELSPAPDEDDNPNQGEGGGENESGDNAASGYNIEGQPPTDVLPDSANSVPLSSGTHAATGASQSNTYAGHTGTSIHQTAPANPFGSDLISIDGLPSSSSSGPSSQPPYATSTPPTSSPAKAAIEIPHFGPSGFAPSTPTKTEATRKFSILLELNAELSRVCEAFVGSGYRPKETPEAQPFLKKFESNLTWMSSRVDGVKTDTGIPDTEPPVLAPSAAHIAFPDGIFDRIRGLYEQLSTAFAKDLMRRNQLFALSGTGIATPVRGNSATPGIFPPSSVGVKRERPDSAGFSRMESPTAPKRRDTGEGKVLTGPNTPTHSVSGGSVDMPPPATPGFSPPSQSQMARPGSSMSGIGPMSSGIHVPGRSDGVFSPSSNSMNMSSNFQGLGNIGGLSPEAQARARQMQIQQAQAMMLQQQQQFQQQQGQQHQQMGQQQGLQQLGAQGVNMAMSSPQRQTQATPSPTRQQQMMQAQPTGSRHMSPPGTVAGLGTGMGMGMNGTDGVGSSQQSGMNSNTPHANMNANVNGVGTSASANMTLNPQILANMGPAAMATYQALQNAQHPITQYLNQQMPGFSQLSMMEQMRRFQIIQQRQLSRNQMMANQMMGGQMRPPNMNASGSGNQQMLSQGGQIGTAPQLQSSTSEGSMHFPGTPTSANMGVTGVSGVSMQQQIGGMSGMPNVPNMANMNPQQRQLYLMQMQMRNAGVANSNLSGSGGVGTGMNPAMMNPQLLQERQRLEQQQRIALAQRHGSPLNPAANSGRDHFPPGLRSNPTPTIGIARASRSPSVSGVGDMAGAATPRIGGRMLPGSEDYQRQVLLQQAQRSAQMQQQQHQQQQGFMQGQGQSAWPGQQPQQLPLSAGAWPQQNQQGFGMGSSTPTSGMPAVDFMTPSRHASTTPAPMGHQSPTAPPNDFGDMMNW
ncbi:hypothetical protein ACEPAG_5949 [Sanghuangporus baumii]